MADSVGMVDETTLSLIWAPQFFCPEHYPFVTAMAQPDSQSVSTSTTVSPVTSATKAPAAPAEPVLPISDRCADQLADTTEEFALVLDRVDESGVEAAEDAATGRAFTELGTELVEQCGLDDIGTAFSSLVAYLAAEAGRRPPETRLFIGGMLDSFCQDLESLLTSQARATCESR